MAPNSGLTPKGQNQPGLVRAALKSFVLRCLFRSAEIPPAVLRARAIVFAPHPDDDALGCGGLISYKKQAGADVDIVYMTDGRKSHSHIVDAEWLVQTRKDEAKASAFCLGVQSSRLHFLGYEDGRLSIAAEDACGDVKELLRRIEPEQVVLPSSLEKHADHQATHEIVTKALDRCGSSVEILEYPVWAWYSWPFIKLVVRGRSEIPRGLFDACKHLSSLSKSFRWSVRVGAMRENKQRAIAAHQSQMVRLVEDSRWGTLADVANGEFLERLTAEREFYSRRSISGVGSGVARLGKMSSRAA